MLRDRSFVFSVCLLLGIPLLVMAVLPLADTSEPRYAEIARLMAESGDWITPWFAPGVPFWGKPPLSFWAQALSFRVLGINEFAVRFPSWLATVAAAWAVYRCVCVVFDRATAQRSVLVYCSFALTFVTSGAVLTDPFLALGTTLCMTGWLMASYSRTFFWRYSFFLGLAIGLLAKGPLALVMVAGVVVPWCVFFPAGRRQWRALPWLSGCALTLLLSVPWYMAAELKTPGFLDYFLIGEHIRRFLDPGWAGDLYGTAHQAPHGMIWYYWLQATFPWGIVACAMLVRAFVHPSSRNRLIERVRINQHCVYFAGWALFTPVFFTFSGNILWTYLLPSLAGLSVLLATVWPVLQPVPAAANTMDSNAGARVFGPYSLLIFLAPLAAIVFAVIGQLQPDQFKTEKQLISYAQVAVGPKAPLLYLYELPFSARFYSKNHAIPATEHDLEQRLQAGVPFVVAVPKDRLSDLPHASAFQPVFENRRYVLLKPVLNEHTAQVAAHPTGSGRRSYIP